jgi:hypothetical protein
MDEEHRNQLIQRYAEGPGFLRQAWQEVPSDARQWRPSPGAWSAHEIVIHCADSETFAATRIRLLAAESSPLIVGYDQDRWAIIFDYHQRSPDLALDVVTSVRAGTSELLRSLGEESWAAQGRHSEQGPYSAHDWLTTYAAHLHDHAHQIRANLAAWRQR